MGNRLTWRGVLAVAVATVIGIVLAVVGILLAFSLADAPLPASLELTGPPPAEFSPAVDFEVVPSPSVDLREHEPVDTTDNPDVRPHNDPAYTRDDVDDDPDEPDDDDADDLDDDDDAAAADDDDNDDDDDDDDDDNDADDDDDDDD